MHNIKGTDHSVLMSFRNHFGYFIIDIFAHFMRIEDLSALKMLFDNVSLQYFISSVKLNLFYCLLTFCNRDLFKHIVNELMIVVQSMLNSLLVTRQMTLFHQGVRMGGWEISPLNARVKRTWTHSHQTFQQRRQVSQGGHSSP